jgi:hypothetical protein
LGDRLAVELAEEFGLSSKQRQRVTEFFESHGQGYVRSKAEIVRSEPRKNAAGALLAALRDDWRAPVPVTGVVASEVDSYSKVTLVKLYDRKHAITAADMLNDRVLPWFEEQGVDLLRILTDRGSEFCGNRERHEYALYLDLEHRTQPHQS